MGTTPLKPGSIEEGCFGIQIRTYVGLGSHRPRGSGFCHVLVWHLLNYSGEPIPKLPNWSDPWEAPSKALITNLCTWKAEGKLASSEGKGDWP